MRLSTSIFCVLLMVACQSTTQEEKASGFNLGTKGTSPVIFAPEIISTSLEERDMAISPDGNEIIFTRGSYDKSQRVLASIRKNDAGWGKPQMLPFSGTYQDIEPFFSPDGNRLYFASKRPIFNDSSRSDYNIWHVEKYKNGWSEPTAIDSTINTKEDEFFPSVAKNGNLYFTATYPNGIGSEDIFMSKKEGTQYLPPQPLDTNINSERYEFNAWVSPDEDMIVFSSYGRPDGFGGGDLYVSKKDAEGNWQPARNLGADINSDRLDYCPFVDLSQNVLYFTSNRKGVKDGALQSLDELDRASQAVDNGLGNVYVVNISN